MREELGLWRNEIRICAGVGWVFVWW